MKIRVSTATASFLGLKNYRIDAIPTTLYFLLPLPCKGACGYCYLRRGYLGRVRWPEFDFEDVRKKLKDVDAKRICIQTTYNEKTFPMLVELLNKIDVDIPITASINPMEREKLEILKENGMERVGMGIDACNANIFKKWKKGTPGWNEYIESLKIAKEVFGNSTAHLIIGLGESDEDAIKFMKFLDENGIDIALFAYSKGGETLVSLPRYRILQIARFFIKDAKFYFENGKIKEMEIPYKSKEAFMTSGCPGCNRPFYNERVTKIYNYPFPLNEMQFEKAMKEAEEYGRIYIASEQ